MIRPTPQVVRALASVAKQYPDVLEFLQDWKRHELGQLPYALNNPALSQGRCQVLCEFVKLVSESPDLAAKPNGTPPTTHTDRSV